MHAILFRSLAVFLLAFAWLAGSLRATTVEIRSPELHGPVFGQVEIEVTVTSREPVARVELEVDGRPAGSLAEPPYRFLVDVGQENAPHVFVAIAVGADGSRSSTRRETPGVPIDEIVDLDLQQIYVTVTDRQERRILDLRRGDFEILDEGKRQEIVTFERGEIPFTAVLLVDASDSMDGERLGGARRGAELFLGGLEGYDEASIVAFADRPMLVSPFSSNPAFLNEAMAGFSPGGGTAIHDYLFLALRRLEARHGRRVVILLSHGRDAHSVLRMQQVREVARRSQALLYWIRILPDEPFPEDGALEDSAPLPVTAASLPSAATNPGLESRLRNRQIVHRVHTPADLRSTRVDSWRDPETNRQQDAILRETITESGGRILVVREPSEIAAAFGEVLSELRDQYAIGYYPSDDRNDGSWHKVRVKLGRGRLEARTGGGYLDL